MLYAHFYYTIEACAFTCASTLIMHGRTRMRSFFSHRVVCFLIAGEDSVPDAVLGGRPTVARTYFKHGDFFNEGAPSSSTDFCLGFLARSGHAIERSEIYNRPTTSAVDGHALAGGTRGRVACDSRFREVGLIFSSRPG